MAGDTETGVACFSFYGKNAMINEAENYSWIGETDEALYNCEIQ